MNIVIPGQKSVSLITGCNGLLLLRSYSCHEFYICNLVTGESTALPHISDPKHLITPFVLQCKWALFYDTSVERGSNLSSTPEQPDRRREFLFIQLYAALTSSERNRLMYDEGNGTPLQLFRLIRRDVSIRISSMKKRFRDTTDNRLAAAKIGRMDLIRNTVVKPVRRPREGWYKLNADGSLSENTTWYGGILRNNEGIVSCAYTVSSSTRSILFLELMGLAAGLEIALEMGVRKISINSDSLRTWPQEYREDKIILLGEQKL
ncbi:hypothetical protein FRX31_033531 [Thalictrum thalictroides]|uniref:RNase H type-1 domain-containing protein n=1 Tax=Thalictrum thalictroides TaxID=46969 RepID=A0A7J6UXB9_THATH|nr:hypothetical protein FRX31_033531 [Thalictrum thalictroides]